MTPSCCLDCFGIDARPGDAAVMHQCSVDQWPRVKLEITFLPPTQGGRTKPPVLVSEEGTYRPHIVIGDPTQRNAITIGNEIRETYLGVVFVSGLWDIKV